MTDTKLTLKLLVDKKAKKVLFAEAGKDFVDFLFYLLSLPVGTVSRLITNAIMIGCIGNLYGSLENLNEAYLQPNQNKDLLLNPCVQTPAIDVPLILPDTNLQPSVRKLYICGSCRQCVTDQMNTECARCSYNTMSQEVQFVGGNKSSGGASLSRRGGQKEERGAEGAKPPPLLFRPAETIPSKYTSGGRQEVSSALTRPRQEESSALTRPHLVPPLNKSATSSTGDRGYVKDLVTYMVTDDLSVSVMSMMSGVSLLNKFNLMNFSVLEEKVVEFGMDEGLELLKASLQSKAVLTSVFLAKEEVKNVATSN